MRREPWRLAWGSAEVPHAVIDILRGCNISCKACYNSAPPAFKTLRQIEQELERLLELRRLHSIVLLGGEVTLHPQLCEIIHLIREKGVHVELFTNAVLLNDEFAARLKAAGTDLVFVHIEPGQVRPDLPPGSSGSRLRGLLEEKASILARHGITAGYSFTAYPEDWEALLQGIQYAVESPVIEYLLITLYRDMRRMGGIHGSLAEELRGEPGRPSADPQKDITLGQVQHVLSERLGLLPFAYVPSNRDASERRWLSYLLGCIVREGKPTVCRPILASAFERIFTKVHRLLTGRASFYQRNRPLRIRLHLLLNAVSGGAFLTNMRLLSRGTLGFGRLKCLRLVFQSPAELDGEGRVIHCLDCPDAALRKGRLVPVCLMDQIVS